MQLDPGLDAELDNCGDPVIVKSSFVLDSPAIRVVHVVRLDGGKNIVYCASYPRMETSTTVTRWTTAVLNLMTDMGNVNFRAITERRRTRKLHARAI